MWLQYAELKPVPNTTYADAFALRESQATDILTQVRDTFPSSSGVSWFSCCGQELADK